MPIKLLDSPEKKICCSEKYNYVFDKKTGFFVRWGEKYEDDPDTAKFPEIMDIEVTTICKGVGGKDGKVGKLCKFCYKSNTPQGKNMSFETYKKLFSKLPVKFLCQIAFGADGHGTANPDLFRIMEYTREQGVIPNITLADISDEVADKLAKVAGGVAVSRYDDENICYDSIKKLTDRVGLPGNTLRQVVLHYMISNETYERAMETLQHILVDDRLKNLKSIVFLSLKPKGRGIGFQRLPQDKFNTMVEFARENNIPLGFDSCSAFKFLQSVEKEADYKQMAMSVEPCESVNFSFYIDVDGYGHPCSFSPGHDRWEEGLDILNCNDFAKDIWNHPRIAEFRERLNTSGKNNHLDCKTCPLGYNI